MYIDLSNAKTTIPQALTDQAETYRKQLFSGTMENTGWVTLPETMTRQKLDEIQQCADDIARKCF